MEEKLLEQSKRYKAKNKKKKRWKKVFNTLACVVVFAVTYALILPAITMEKTSYCGFEKHSHEEKCYAKELVCGQQEGENTEAHTHNAQCYSQESQLTCQLQESAGHTHSEACKNTSSQLVCGMEEGAEHTHGGACYQTVESIVCGLEENAGHAHTDGCYTVQDVLVCELSEQAEATTHKHTDTCYKKELTCEKEEHEHSLICYSNKDADVESALDWEATLPDKLTGIWADDVLEVAKSQLGYEESTRNYTVTEDGETLGYSRYGDWYGDSYGHWCAMYVSFCLHYAGVDVELLPLDANCEHWIDTLSKEKYNLYHKVGTYEPEPGDLIFFDWGVDGDSDHIGFVVENIPATENEAAKIKTIEGNASNVVKYRTYTADDPQIMGYGELPENPKMQDETEKQTIEAVIYTDETFATKAEDDKTVITVSGYFPEGIEAKAYPVELEEDTIEGRRVLLAYDITLFDKEGNKFDTEKSKIPMTVTIEPAEWEIEDEKVDSEDCEIYYVPEEGEPESMETSTEEDVVSFQTEHFSTYALTVSGKLSTVYLNGATGDDSRDGETSTNAVKSLEKALSLVKAGGTIYITGTVDVEGDVEIDVADEKGVTIKREASFTGALITVANGGSLELRNVRVNGECGTPSASNIATNSTYATFGNNKNAKAPLIVVVDGGWLTVGEGAVLEYNSNQPTISNNKFVENGYVGLGGAIYCSGTLTMNGGLIQYCEAQCGGGVYVENGSFYLNGGTIDHCYARDGVSYSYRVSNYHKNAGGGVYVGDNSTMVMSGGTVSNNQSSREGGGISLGWLNRSDNAGIDSYITTFTMNGGTITGNYAVSTGGGLNITAGRQAFVNAGYITSNTALGREYQDESKWFVQGQKYAYVFSGGGIYIDAAQWSDYSSERHDGVPGKAVINRVLVTDNTATSYGGGVAACGTSINFVYGEADSNNGTAIYGNTANSSSYSKELYVEDGDLELGAYVLGGEKYNWSNKSVYYGIGYSNSLTDTSTAIKKAEGLATVFIKNNTAYLGGGIGCNGLIEIGGEKEESTYINIKKVWEDDGTVPHPEYIEVQILQDGKPYGDPVRIYRRIDEDGKEVWPAFYKGGLPSGHKYTVKELDVPGYMATIDQNGQDFVITNKPVGFQVVKKWLDENGDELTEELPKYIEVQLYQNGVAYGETVQLNADNEWLYIWQNLPKKDGNGNPYSYTAKEISIPDGFYSSGEGVIDESGKCIITNTKSPVTSISVEKKWADGVAGAESVTVQLFQDGKPYREPVILSSSNNWFNKWEGLPIKDADGNEVTYEIQESPVAGYTSKVTEGDTSLKQYTWATAEKFANGTQYMLVSEEGALAADGNGGLIGVDVTSNLEYGTMPAQTVLWTAEASSSSSSSAKLKNGNGTYLYLNDSAFISSKSSSTINYIGQKLYVETGALFWKKTYYLANTSGATSETGGLTFTLWEVKDVTLDYGDSHFVITNTKNLDSLTINFAKYAKGGDEPTLLAGAELVLYKQDSSGEVIPGTNNVKGIEIATWTSEDTKTSVDGIKSEALFSGTYYLVETKTPPGHAGLKGPIIFIVDAEAGKVTIDTYPGYENVAVSPNSFPIYNEILYELPETGGIGTNIFTIGGALIMLISLLGVYIIKRKEA